MEGYITFSQLGLLIVFLLVLAVGGYAIVTLRNVNAAFKDIGEILRENKGALNKSIPNIATALESAAAIINRLHTNPGELIKTIATTDPIATYAAIIGETAKAIVNLLTTIRKQ